AIPVLKDMNGLEIVEQVMIQFIGQLNGRGANEQRHALVGFKIDVFKGLDLDKMLYPGQKSLFSGLIEAGIIGIAAGKEGIVVAGFGLQKPALSSMPGQCPAPAAHDGKKEYG